MYKLFALAGGIALAVAFGASVAREDGVTSIDEIMSKAHGKSGLRAKINAATKGKKWDDASKSADEWVKLAIDLGKNKPPKGGADSWKKMTDSYEKDVKALATAIKGKQDAGIKSALAGINKSCGGCHKAHKP